MKKAKLYIIFFCLICLIVSGCEVKEGKRKSAGQTDANKVESQPMPVTAKAAVVKSGAKEGEESSDILDIKPLQAIKNNFAYLYVFLGLVILLLILAGIGIWLYLRKKRKVEVENRPPPDEIALGELERLMASEYLKTGNYRSFYFRLSEIFRAYMEARFCFPAQESTTEELIPKIEGQTTLTRAQKDTVRLLTRWEDLVKFAMHTPTHEKAQKDWEDTRQIILETGQKPSEEDKGFE